MNCAKGTLLTLWVTLFAFAALAVAEGPIRPSDGPPLRNWQAPATYTPPHTAARVRPLGKEGEISLGPLPFFPITPCRQYDSRNFTPLPDNTPRTVALVGAPCGIPSTSLAISLNITVFNIVGAPSNAVFRLGTVSPPTTAWINYPPSETQRANAGVAPTDFAGNVVVQVNQGAGHVDFTIDVNGYYYNGAFGTEMPFGDSFIIISGDGSTGLPAILGRTDSTKLNASGVKGIAASSSGVIDGVWGQSFSASDFGIGVLGTEEGSSGLTYGVYGRSVSSTTGAAGVYGENTASGQTFGVFGRSVSSTTGAAGVYGENTAGGQTLGVHGKTSSTSSNAAGVYGEAPSSGTGDTHGVSGYSASGGIFAAGVVGTASQAAANGGFFDNTAASLRSLLCTQSGDSFGLFTNGVVEGQTFKTFGPSPSFIAPHPVDPSKEIQYFSVEAATMDVYFRGTGTLTNGYARIELPDHFRLTARDGTYMTTLTPVGKPTSLSVESEGAEGIVVRGNGNTRFHYVVYAERAEIEGYEPVQKNVHFTPAALEKVQMLKTLPQSTKALLIRNGTLNADGSYKEETARAMGWTIPEPSAAELIPHK